MKTNHAIKRRRESGGICILGPTGLGQVMLENFRANGREVACFVDPQGKFRGDSWAGLPVVKLDGHDKLPALKRSGIREFAIGSGATASRARLFEGCIEAGLTPVTMTHPTATVLEGVQIARGCVIGARALIGVGVVLEENCLVGMGSLLDRECIVQRHSTIGAGAVLGAQTILEERTFVGDAVTTLPGRRVGKSAVLISGSVITQDIPPESIVAGVPARLIRRKREPLGTDESRMMRGR